MLVLVGSVAHQIMSSSQADGTGYLKWALQNEFEDKAIDLVLNLGGFKLFRLLLPLQPSGATVRRWRAPD